MGYTDLEELDLGNSSAEKESERIFDYFFETPSYKRAIRGKRRKVFFVGNKGAGKSALFRKLANEFAKKPKNIVMNIFPSQFTYELFEEKRGLLCDEKSFFSRVWEKTLFIQICTTVVTYFDRTHNIKSHKEAVSILKKYLENNGVIESDDLMGVFIGLLDRMKVTLGGVEISARTGGNGSSDRETFRRASGALSEILGQYAINIFVDELDQGWDDSPGAENFFYGLFDAMRLFRQREDRILFFVSMRVDMFKSLGRFVDAEKVREDIEELSWNRTALTSVIARRIEVGWPRKSRGWSGNQEIIRQVFKDDAFDYILDHTLMRPREVIYFCSRCLEEIVDVCNAGHRKFRKVNISLVKSIEFGISEGRLEDLAIEYKFIYPGLRSVFRAFENRPQHYSMSEFCSVVELALLNLSDKGGVEGNWAEILFGDIKKVVEILYEIGFIKIKMGGEYLAHYEKALLNISNVSHMKIHRAFVSALKCTSE